MPAIKYLLSYIALGSLLVWSSVSSASECDYGADEECLESSFGKLNDRIDQYWELTPEHKRGLYRMRTFQANYLLPYHYSSNINQRPSSPTLGPAASNGIYRNHEAKIQISLRTKVREDFLLPNADIWVAYTQTSMWQIWTHEDSAPFRSTDHNPEIFYVVPVTEQFDFFPGPINLRMFRFGLAHQSNGQREPESRSWNYWVFSGAFDIKDVFFEATYKRRINESIDNDDNPDLVHYGGNLETSFTGVLNTTTYRFTRTSPNFSLNRGAWQLDLTHPVYPSMPDGIRFHLQIFSGYNETMLDYNHRQNRTGIGFVLFNI